MCTFILESDTFSKCCHWHWRGGKRHCQHQVVIKQWRASQQSTTADSCLMSLSCIPPKPRAAPALNYGQYLTMLGQITPPICSSQVARCSMHVPSCLRASQWFCPSFCGVMGAPTWDHCCFYFSLLLYAYQYGRMQSRWLFKWMHVWTNISFLNIKKTPCVIFRVS